MARKRKEELFSGVKSISHTHLSWADTVVETKNNRSQFCDINLLSYSCIKPGMKMRAKVSSESEDDSISMLTQFHPAWRKMVPMCYRSR